MTDAKLESAEKQALVSLIRRIHGEIGRKGLSMETASSIDAVLSGYPNDRSHPMKPFATFTIKVFDDKDPETEIDWAAIATPAQSEKLIQALETNFEILKPQRIAHHD